MRVQISNGVEYIAKPDWHINGGMNDVPWQQRCGISTHLCVNLLLAWTSHFHIWQNGPNDPLWAFEYDWHINESGFSPQWVPMFNYGYHLWVNPITLSRPGDLWAGRVMCDQLHDHWAVQTTENLQVRRNTQTASLQHHSSISVTSLVTSLQHQCNITHSISVTLFQHQCNITPASV